MGEGYTGGRTVQTSLGKQYFLLIWVRFGLRGLKEQYELRRYPDSQINIVKINGKDALVYREFQSKTRQGGISDRGKNPARVSYSFCTGVRSRCLVELFRKYLFLGPRGLTIGPGSMFKLILSGSQGLTIGTPTGL